MKKMDHLTRKKKTMPYDKKYKLCYVVFVFSELHGSDMLRMLCTTCRFKYRFEVNAGKTRFKVKLKH